MRIEKAGLILGLILAPMATAGAQFTTVVAPPPAQKQAIAMAEAKKAEVPRDTGHRATLQAMSAWVDSVAGDEDYGEVCVDFLTKLAADAVAAATGHHDVDDGGVDASLP